MLFQIPVFAYPLYFQTEFKELPFCIHLPLLIVYLALFSLLDLQVNRICIAHMRHKAEAGGEEEWIKNLKHTNNRKMIVETTNS